jgi:hypothetical protein
MKINYYIDKQHPDNKGEYRIFMSAHYFGKRLRVYTRLKTPMNDWDEKKQRMKTGTGGAVLTNAVLESYRRELLDVYTRANLDRIDPTIEFMRENLTFIRKPESDFFSVWNRFTGEEKQHSEWTKSMLNRLDTAKKHLEQFDKIHPLAFKSMNDAFLDRFIKYHHDRGLSNAFTEQQVQILKRFLDWATRRGYNRNLDYRDFHVKLRKPSSHENAVYLYTDELLNLVRCKIPKSSLAQTRDVFCFSCLTGQTYRDLAGLTSKDLSDSALLLPGKRYPDDTLALPIPVYAREYLRKFRKLPGDKAIPLVSNQKYNESLKILGKMAGLTRLVPRIRYIGSERIVTSHPLWSMLTSRVSKRTFLAIGVFCDISLETMIALTGYPIDLVQKHYAVDSDHIKSVKKRLDTAFGY